MEPYSSLLKKGNLSSATATLGNLFLSFVKGIAAFVTGSGTMYASAMHSLADAVNQGFVFVGSILAEKKPTPRFPTGFGRLVNLFCIGAVIVVSYMAFETIREGFHLVQNPVETDGFWLNVSILLVTILIDGSVLIRAMKEIVRDAGIQAKGIQLFLLSYRHVRQAAPPTRLVFYEDTVATFGAFLALIAVIVTEFTPFQAMDGITTMAIGFLMLLIAGKVGLENMAGLIGVAAPKEVKERVAKIIFSDPYVTDIYKLRVIQEGRFYHVESLIELKPGLTLAEADDIKFRIRDRLLAEPNIRDVILGILEDNGVKDWTPEEDKVFV